MTPARFETITSRYAGLRIAIAGDFCLDRYFEIDPARQEISIETGLSVHNVTRVRCQPGAAGTILNNLVALGIGSIHPVGFRGDDGEGWELERALQRKAGVHLDQFVKAEARQTFTYSKPLVLEKGKPPVELSRLDMKNWSPTPDAVQERLCDSLTQLFLNVEGVIVMDQVDVPETGVVTTKLLKTLGELSAKHPEKVVIADSRRGLRGFPPVIFKMNAAELATLAGVNRKFTVAEVMEHAAVLARRQGRPVFVSMAEQGIVGAEAAGAAHHVPSLPLRGEIDVVGAGDSVTANLTAALAAGASVHEAMELAMGAASIVVHQLGTTGTASVPELKALMSSTGLIA